MDNKPAVLAKLQNYGRNMLSDDFSYDILNIIRDEFCPEDIFSEEALETWAHEHGWTKE